MVTFQFEVAIVYMLMIASISMHGYACWHLYVQEKAKREREEHLKRIRLQTLQKPDCYCNKNCYNGCNGQDCID